MTDSVPGRTALYPAMRALISDALQVGVGGTLPTNADYLSRYGIGAGTMQRALNTLTNRGALRVVSRGHLGRLVVDLEAGQAWQAAGFSPVRLLFPRADPTEIRTLEQRVGEELLRRGVPFSSQHLPGAAARMASVDDGDHDVAIISSGAYRSSASAGTEADRSRELEPGTYYAADRIVVVQRNSDFEGAPHRIAIDLMSQDHMALTRDRFPESEGYVHINTRFHHVPAAVARNIVDAGIWHVTPSVIPLDIAGLVATPLEMLRTRSIWEGFSRTVIYMRAMRPEVAAIISAIDFSDLLTHQEAAFALEAEDWFSLVND